MIVVDSSAIIAIFEEEEDATTFADAIASGEGLVMSAVNVHETAIALHRRGAENVEDLWRFLKVSNIEIAPFDKDQARTASEAYARYGKGFHSRVRLNLADCAAYALARSLSAPLLFKGDDFKYTDVEQWR